MKPQLSIIIPVLNEAEQLAAFLSALQAFRGRAEIVLVDGGSQDGSVEIATAWVDQLLQSPKGRARQMNCGAKQAKADVLLFLHADTILPENAIDLIEKAIADGYLWGRFDVRLDSPLPIFKVISFMMNWRSRLTGIATGDQAMFVTNQAFQAVNGFQDIDLMEDIALSSQLKKLAKPCCLSTKVVTSARRWLKHGIVKTILLMWWLRLCYFLGADPADLVKLYYPRH
jgi:rSAM/selenodomain-associated transferase 2